MDPKRQYVVPWHRFDCKLQSLWPSKPRQFLYKIKQELRFLVCNQNHKVKGNLPFCSMNYIIIFKLPIDTIFFVEKRAMIIEPFFFFLI